MSFSLQRNNSEVEREDQFADLLSVILFKEVKVMFGFFPQNLMLEIPK